MKLATTAMLVLLSISSLSQPAGYAYGKHILINETQIPGAGALTNFPVLVTFTSNDLRHTSSGGHVQNINGYDILFTAGNCFTVLSHQIESYNPVTGNLVAWVRIPSLSATVNTGIQMYYGNASASTNPSTTATWNAGYDGVWHLHSDLLDGSSGGNNGTNNGSVNASPGFIADGQNFVDPNHWIELTTLPNRAGSFSCTGWFRSADVTRAGQRIICDDATNVNGCYAVSLGDPGTGQLRFYIRGLSVVTHDTPNIIANNTWYHFAAVFDAATMTKYLYVNGALSVSGPVTGTLAAQTGNASMGGEVAAGETANRFHGDLDEIRTIPAVLSASWVTAEYNNQNNPAAFYTISAEMSATSLCVLLPIELLEFEATFLDEQQHVRLDWKTASERNNDFFVIERSADGINWQVIATEDGAGNSSNLLHYDTLDVEPLRGLNYYRLKQVDFDGAFSYSPIRSVNTLSTTKLELYPNPASDELIVVGSTSPETGFTIYSSTGQFITTTFPNNASDGAVILSVSTLPQGVYYLKNGSTVEKFVVVKN